MALSRPVRNVPVAEQERTWRANLETPRDGRYSIQVYREVVQVDANGNAMGQALRKPAFIHRDAAAIASESVEVNGATVSASLVLAALPRFFDRWAEEDAAAASSISGEQF